MSTIKYGFAAAGLAAMSASLSGCALKQAAVSKHVSPAAIDGFLKIDGDLEGALHEYCNGENMQMHNITSNIWWPGCGMISKMDEFKTKDEGGKCEAGGCVDPKVMGEMDAFNKKWGGQRVSYNSRHAEGVEDLMLTGWFLPAEGCAIGECKENPRIVVQHGFTSNSNKFRSMFAGYLLRKLGYHVLLNNFRDHCYSDDSKARIVSWGHAYPMDVLGAWDYLRTDAAGTGELPAHQVGLFGFSMGAFTTANAFGMESQVPAAWLDGPPITPQAGFEVGFKKAVGNDFVASHIADNVWSDIEKEAKKKGIDLNAHLPEKELPKGKDIKRKVFLTSNTKDNTVAFSSGEAMAKLLKKYPEKYDLEEFWAVEATCADETHCVDFLTKTDEYTAKLKNFWGKVFTKVDTKEDSKTDTKETEKKEDSKTDTKETDKKEDSKTDTKKTDKKDDKASRLYEQQSIIHA